MLSRDANYNMDTALNEINEKKLLSDVKVETQLILQLLVAKKILSIKSPFYWYKSDKK